MLVDIPRGLIKYFLVNKRRFVGYFGEHIGDTLAGDGERTATATEFLEVRRPNLAGCRWTSKIERQ